MTKEEVIALARKSEGEEQQHGMWRMHVEDLERFAALVAAHEREHICKQIAMLHDSLSLTGTTNWGKT